MPPASTTATISLTKDDLANIVAAAVRAALAPSPEEQAKKDAEAATLEEKRLQMVKDANEWLVQREQMQASCDHKKPRGEDAFIAKLYSDGVYRVMCLRCQKFVTETVANQQQIAMIIQSENLGVSSWENFGRFSSGWIDNGQTQQQG